MNNKAQSSFAIGIIVALLIVIFLVIAGILLYNLDAFKVFKTGKVIGVDKNDAQTNPPVVVIINKPTAEETNNNEGIGGEERGYLDYTDWKKETEDQCTVYIRNTGDVPGFFTVEFYLEDKNSSDERETDREKYLVPGEKESFSVSIDENERCDYEVYTDKDNGRYLNLDTMDDYDYYRYIMDSHDSCDDDSDGCD
jgi:hypothetical protein